MSCRWNNLLFPRGGARAELGRLPRRGFMTFDRLTGALIDIDDAAAAEAVAIADEPTPRRSHGTAP